MSFIGILQEETMGNIYWKIPINDIKHKQLNKANNWECEWNQQNNNQTKEKKALASTKTDSKMRLTHIF
jgi:hypothetical protein